MKTNNSKRFGLFCLLMLSVVGAQAQSWNYPKVENGNTIVSRDAAKGIKEDALLTLEQKTFLMNQTTQPIYNDASEYNRVSAKFEVASTDAPTSSTWAEAYSFCKSYSTGAAAGSWRLPTQRELMLMWVLKSNVLSDKFFWSSTEASDDDGSAWTTYNDDMEYIPKTDMCFVRCVRDL